MIASGMEYVSSSNLQAVGYDEESEILRVMFRNGAVYEYIGVPTDVYVGLMESASKGAYFNFHIRDRFNYRKVA